MQRKTEFFTVSATASGLVFNSCINDSNLPLSYRHGQKNKVMKKCLWFGHVHCV